MYKTTKNQEYIESLEAILDQIRTDLENYQLQGFEGCDIFYDRMLANVTDYENLLINGN